jgi:hypothetical protein
MFPTPDDCETCNDKGHGKHPGFVRERELLTLAALKELLARA